MKPIETIAQDQYKQSGFSLTNQAIADLITIKIELLKEDYGFFALFNK